MNYLYYSVVLLTGIIFSNSALAVFGWPETAIEGYVFIRDDPNCKDVTCGEPVQGAKISISLPEDKISLWTESSTYSDASGHFETDYVLGCGKVEMVFEYQNLYEMLDEYNASCLMTGEKTVTVTWAIDRWELSGSSSSNPGNSNGSNGVQEFRITDLVTAGGYRTARIIFSADVADGEAELDFEWNGREWYAATNTGVFEWEEAGLNRDELIDKILLRIPVSRPPTSVTDFISFFSVGEVFRVSSSSTANSSSNIDNSTSSQDSLLEIEVSLEEPTNLTVQSGIGNIRGWAVAESGVDRVELSIDNKFIAEIPYGGKRADVQNNFPTYQDSNYSGFSMAYNFSNLPEGEHLFKVRAYSKSGDYRDSSSKITVQRFHDSFIDSTSPIGFTSGYVYSDGKHIILNNITVDGVQYDVQLQWRKSSQGFEINSITPVH